MASSGPIDQQKWEFAPPAETYAGEAPSFAGMIPGIDKEYAWISFENVLKVYDARTRNLVAEYEFFDESHQECTVSYVTPAKINGIPHLILSTHNTPDLSQIRIIDLRVQRIEGMLVIPYNVSVMTYFERSDQYPVGRSDLFNKFKEILAIGVKGGRIVILDLYHTGKSVQRTIIPVEITNYDHHEFFSQESRETKNAHPYVQLNDDYHSKGQVSIYPPITKKEYGKYFPDVADLIPIASKQIQVTAISYIPQIRAIAVGYSIGCFQFYSASHLELVFCSPNESDRKANSVRSAPISHFLYQELPDDDYGYLWIARGSVPSAKLYQPSKAEQMPSILLHLLKFKDDVNERMRTNDEDTDMDMGEDILKNINNLHQISTKEIDITKYTPHTVGRVIHCAVLCDANTNKEEYLKGETNIAEERQTRAVFLWESAGKIHMEVLDIARMEKFLEKSDSALERIMLDPTIVQSLPLHTIPIDLPLLSVWINPKTVMDFTAARSLGLDDNLVGGMESAARTSVAPSFEVKFLYYNAIYQLNFLNTQQLALWELTRAGPYALHVPAECHRLCERAGLLVNINNLSNRDETTSQRHQLFCLALQHNLVSTVCAYIKKVEPDNTFLLANPKPIFDWAWESFLKLSSFVNNMFFNQQRNLFQASEISPTERAQLLWDLGEVSVRLQDLYSVFEALIAREEGWTEAAAETVSTLRARQDKITSSGQRLQVMTWLVQSDVLPPSDESELANMFAELYQSYESYRVDRVDKYNANNWKVENMQGIRLMADSNKAGILFIDILVERAKKAMKRVETFEEEEMQMDEEQWEKPDLDAYPPSDIQQLVLCHKDPESVLTARSLILYFLYDMLDITSAPDTELADSFAATTMLTVAQRKTIHAFWILDKLSASQYGVLTDRMADALKLLLEANELEDWTSKILRTFWDYGGHASGLSFYRAYFATPGTPPYTLSIDDAVACVNVLLANGFVQEAMEFQRSFVSRWEEEGEGRTGRNRKIQYLLFHVLRHSIENTNTLQKLFQLHFNEFEDQCVQHYLAYHSLTTPAPYINDVPVLIFYLLRRARHAEALACYEKLRAERPDIDTTFLTTLIEGIRLTLPRIQARPNQSRLFPYMESTTPQLSQLVTHRKAPQKETPLFNSFARPELAPGEVLFVPGRQARVVPKPRPTPAKKQPALPQPNATPQFQYSLPSTIPLSQSSVLSPPLRPSILLAPPGQTPFAKSLSFSDSMISPPASPHPSSSLFGPPPKVPLGDIESVFRNLKPATYATPATPATPATAATPATPAPSALRASASASASAPSAMRQTTLVRSAMRTLAPALQTSTSASIPSTKRSVKFADDSDEEEDEQAEADEQEEEEEEEEEEEQEEKRPPAKRASIVIPDYSGERDKATHNLADIADEDMEDEEENEDEEDNEEDQEEKAGNYIDGNIEDEDEYEEDEEEDEEEEKEKKQENGMEIDDGEDEEEEEEPAVGDQAAEADDDDEDNVEQGQENQHSGAVITGVDSDGEEYDDGEEEGEREMEENVGRDTDEREPRQNQRLALRDVEDGQEGEEEDEDEDEDEDDMTRDSNQNNVTGSEQEEGDDEEEVEGYNDKAPLTTGRRRTKPSPKVPSKGYPVELDAIGSSGEDEEEEISKDQSMEADDEELQDEEDEDEEGKDSDAEHEDIESSTATRGEEQEDQSNEESSGQEGEEGTSKAKRGGEAQVIDIEDDIDEDASREKAMMDVSADHRSSSEEPSPSQTSPIRSPSLSPDRSPSSDQPESSQQEPERAEPEHPESENDSGPEREQDAEPEREQEVEPERERDSESDDSTLEHNPAFEPEMLIDSEEEKEEEPEPQHKKLQQEPEPESEAEPEPVQQSAVDNNRSDESEPESDQAASEPEPKAQEQKEDEGEVEMEERTDLYSPLEAPFESTSSVVTKHNTAEGDGLDSDDETMEGEKEDKVDAQTNHGKQNGSKGGINHESENESELSEAEQERVLAASREREQKEQELLEQAVKEHEKEEKSMEKGNNSKDKVAESEESDLGETPRRRGRPRKSKVDSSSRDEETKTSEKGTAESDLAVPVEPALPARRAKLVAAHNIHVSSAKKTRNDEETGTPKKSATPAKKSATPAKPRSTKK